MAARARRLRLLNDYEALALSLPHLKGDDLVQIGGQESPVPRLKIVMGPGTGLGMAALAPLPKGGWMALAGELGQVTLPTVTREEFDLRERMKKPGSVFIAEDAVSGSGLHLIYRTLSPQGKLTTPEAVIQAALKGQDAVAAKTLEHFVAWLARISGDAAMALQARGGVYLAGGIAPSIIDKLKSGPFRTTFEDKGKLSDIMRPLPVYVIVDKFPASRDAPHPLPSEVSMQPAKTKFFLSSTFRMTSAPAENGCARRDEVVPLINDFAKNFKHVVMTQDWHPAGHSSFASSHPGKDIFSELRWPMARKPLPITAFRDPTVRRSTGCWISRTRTHCAQRFPP